MQNQHTISKLVEEQAYKLPHVLFPPPSKHDVVTIATAIGAGPVREHHYLTMNLY
jgi:hypothetical protein